MLSCSLPRLPRPSVCRKPRTASPSGSPPAARAQHNAEVEGRLHRRPPEQVHFHELGGLDAIVDVVGTCAALEVLGGTHLTIQP